MNKYVIYCRKSSESDERQIQSLGDQISTLMPFIQQHELTIVGEPLQESKSAKLPGRPLFNQMTDMIEKGLANGIILLNPTRLSRNTVDTGQIIFLMDQGKLEEVITPYQTFKNNPYDKFMLNLLCTQAKLENDNKSVYIKDSMRLKAERGDYPGKAPPGYINNHMKSQGLRDISPHPVYFSLMRQLFDQALTGNYSIEKLSKMAHEMGIRKDHGKVIGKTSFYRYLRDPFYIGKFVYKGKEYKGNHKPMLTEKEYKLLQNILDGKARGKQQRHTFALNELIKCGECQYCVTAESHTKKYKNGTFQTFSYYRCSKKSKSKTCSQKYLAEQKVEDQVIDRLLKFELEKEFQEWAFEALDEVAGEDHSVTEDQQKAFQTALDAINKKINNLTELKISPDNSDDSLLSNEEFVERRRKLLEEKEKVINQLNTLNGTDTEWEEIAEDTFQFALEAANRFQEDEHPDDKKTIVKTIGSYLTLQDQKIHFQPQLLFIKYQEGVDRTKQEINRLVPNNCLSNQSKLHLRVKNSIWYTRRDSNPRPLRSKRSALSG